MNTTGSEIVAGTIFLLLILVAAAILLPGTFAQVGGEWRVVLDWAVPR